MGPLLLLVILASVTIGASHAYQADSRAEASYSYDDYFEEVDEPASEDVENRYTAAMIENGMKMGLWIAGAVGYWLYPHTGWLPVWLVSGTLRVLSLVPVAWVALNVLRYGNQVLGDPA